MFLGTSRGQHFEADRGCALVLLMLMKRTLVTSYASSTSFV